MKDIGKAREGRIAMKADAIESILSQMQRQRAVGAKQAEECVGEPCWTARCSGMIVRQGRWREMKKGLLAEPHRLLAWPLGRTDFRAIVEVALQKTGSAQETVVIGRFGERLL